jgi:SAM-dependent methyltransferase
VRYVGVDPFPASAESFATALRALERVSLSTEVHTSTFDALRVAGQFDVVTFVHSMYYVTDIAATLAAAYALLRPGGELLVLSAPRAELNALVEVLAPPLEGHDQWFSDDVGNGLHQAGMTVEAATTLDAGLDADGASDEVLDFTVQARLTPELRPLVRAYLDEVAVPSSVPGTGWRVPHPVDVYRVVRAS